MTVWSVRGLSVRVGGAPPIIFYFQVMILLKQDHTLM